VPVSLERWRAQSSYRGRNEATLAPNDFGASVLLEL